MGKASSSKKVARAARAGGKTKGQRKQIAFPAALVVLVVLGLGLVAFARSTNPGDGSPQLGEHWHAAYGVYVCDRWVANLSDSGADSLGIHTHDDGLVHIHPFLAGATGESATIGKFFEQIGMSVSDSSITLPPGEQFGSREYKNGETTCDGERARVVIANWDDAVTAGEQRPDDVRTSDISGEHFDTNQGAYTIAFLPEGEDIPPPPSAADIVSLGAQDGAPGELPAGAPDGSDLEDLPEGELPEGVDPGAPAGDPGTEPPPGVPPPGEPLPGEVPPAGEGEVPPEGEGDAPPADGSAPGEPPASSAPPSEPAEAPGSTEEPAGG